ncbi:MAG: glutamyl-tRNA amidotransferase [Methylomonas sp.]|nr:MAG: glutamyl-tRNA amidotransferase [Methylobacter sp.]PPD32286.1 MAG: glutamyl-tRNA amidotransferase [Methylomonas sp.]
MTDEYFTEFLEGEGFAPAIECRSVDEETFSHYRGKLPDRLLKYWQEYGLCGYGDGLFWIVNPADYKDILEQWLINTTLWGKDDYHVIARTAFGTLYIWGEKSGARMPLDAYEHTLLPSDTFVPVDKETKERFMGNFFSNMNKEYSDTCDSGGKFLFKKALKKLGPLKHDEIYAFVPALALGGSADIKNLQKVKIFDQLSILAQLEELTIMKTVKEVFGNDL